MKLFLLIIVSVFIGGCIGYILAMLVDSNKKAKNPDGTIFLEKNEEGIDRIRFYLNMEYDDISDHSKIVFNVKKNF